MTEYHCSIVLIGCSNRLGYRVRPRQLHRIGPIRCDGEIILSAIVTKLIFEPKLVFGIFFGDKIGNFRSSWHCSSAKLKHCSNYLSTRSQDIKDRTWLKTVGGKTQAHLSTAAVPSWNSAVITWAQAARQQDLIENCCKQNTSSPSHCRSTNQNLLDSGSESTWKRR